MVDSGLGAGAAALGAPSPNVDAAAPALFGTVPGREAAGEAIRPA
jgi:hypothetical protein